MKFEIFPNEQMEAHIILPDQIREPTAKSTDDIGQIAGRCGFAGC
jgi:hypothetical protein